MSIKPVKVALIGSGNISYTYLNTLCNGGFNIIEVVGCSDIIPERSKARAELFGIRQMTNEEILNDPEIEIVINTTQLWNHEAVTRQILEAGKNVYSEKAMGHNYEGAKANYELAKAKGLRLGSAPDCYMGSAFQTARKLLDDGAIGKPLIAHAMCYRGYNAHQAPGFPADPMAGSQGTTITYDMAGYYTNILINMLGPVNRVSGYTRFYEDNVYENPKHPNYKEPVKSELNGIPRGDSMLLGALEFENGVYGSLTLCSEGFFPETPRMEILGTHGILTMPDPNFFGGWDNQVYITRSGNSVDGKNEVFRVPLTHGFSDTDPSIPPLSGKHEPCHNSWRGLAVVDMAYAIRRGRPHRSSAELALHTVEILDRIEKSCKDNKVYTLESRPERPAPLAPGFYGGACAETAIDNI
ncbi:MAG: Gfo/Idh/MocA family oxidoreductase [Clostridia bacterium]|nr:Gfo/Idh/MocA family oxidoreductase [Clostridia bacterium]